MEGLAVLIVVITALVMFGSTLRGSANVLNNVVQSINEVSDDTMQTYTAEVLISNASKRSDQADRIAELDEVYSVTDIRQQLKAKKAQK